MQDASKNVYKRLCYALNNFLDFDASSESNWKMMHLTKEDILDIWCTVLARLCLNLINCATIEAVQTLPNIDEDLLFEAFEFLEKEKNAEMFIAIKTYEADGWRYNCIKHFSIFITLCTSKCSVKFI